MSKEELTIFFTNFVESAEAVLKEPINRYRKVMARKFGWDKNEREKND